MGMLGVDMFVSKLMDRLNVEGGCWLEVCVPVFYQCWMAERLCVLVLTLPKKH